MVMIILITIIINPIIKNKEKRRPKILTEIKQTNLETNYYDPTTTLLRPTTLPRFESSRKIVI